MSKPWVLFAFTVLVAFVAQLLARHSFQVHILLHPNYPPPPPHLALYCPGTY